MQFKYQNGILGNIHEFSVGAHLQAHPQTFVLQLVQYSSKHCLIIANKQKCLHIHNTSFIIITNELRVSLIHE